MFAPRLAALLLLVVLPGHAFAKTKKECADKCAQIVKTCGDQCTANFPRDKASACRKACKASSDKCNEQCLAKKEGKAD